MLKTIKLTTTLTIVFLILIKNVAQIASSAANTNFATFEENNKNNDETHRLTKRMDLESCLGQFDVHKNTIIRTGESQAIGGKYLQGIELETMEECQRLCCETDSCDVYIFESKKDGYCYLFECGTPENFHCKFTRHANYTSAVLTPVLRPVNEVTTARPPPATHLAHSITSNISQQEWELSNLKMKPEVKEKTNDLPLSEGGAMNSLNTNNKKSLAGVEAGLIQKVNTSVQCGRFQFACHSGECIAVYNACDGIPQCEDGSDEGPECSGANNNMNTNVKTLQDTVVANKVMTASSISQYPASSLAQQTPQQQLQSMQQQHSQSPAIIPSVGLVNNREDPNVWESRKIVSGSPTQVAGNGNIGNPESSNLNQLTAQQQLQQQQQQQQQGDSFTSYVNNRNQNNAVYGVGSSTLEQSGLYMPHVAQEVPNNVYVGQQPQQQQQHILLPPPPPPPPAPLNSNWQQQAILNQQKQQQKLAAQAISSQQQQSLPEVSSSYVGQNEAIPQQQQQQTQLTNTVLVQQQQQQSAQNLVPSLIQQQPAVQTQGVTLNNGAANNEQKLEDSDEYEDSEEKSTEPPKKHKHKKVKSKSKDSQKSKDDHDDTKSHMNSIKNVKSAISPVHEQYEIIHQNMALEFRDHDGQSERPGGAVLSLTLGLLITAALAILIGCRMRTVGRRARRLGGKTPYSHEADFLVNGMYL
ncbi:hypothetical protein FF38_07631 [Lucilia cuprina]|uniref:MANSC domain-containing protein n=1 Tax=Lucilia cuprina TaxID=7375 RepID=A0A0L0BZD3_LUCCU|nr:Low-density lipoprotein receptor-related protein 11 [Lucilia cuprina]KNC25375.1 hypothetical protein FF38_07631 [Lucilia cuprina]